MKAGPACLYSIINGTLMQEFTIQPVDLGRRWTALRGGIPRAGGLQ